MTLQEINYMEQQQFVETLGWIFENSPWVAERSWKSGAGHRAVGHGAGRALEQLLQRRRRPVFHRRRLPALLPDAAEWRHAGRRATAGPQDRGPDAHEPAGAPGSHRRPVDG